MLLSDADCDSFVGAHASDEEQRAYGLLRTGAQRADLFRILFLKVIGGVYADLDLELRTPLREVLPPQASLVAGSTWNFAFLAYQRNHVRRNSHRVGGTDCRTVEAPAARRELMSQSSTNASPHSDLVLGRGLLALLLLALLRGVGVGVKQLLVPRLDEALARAQAGHDLGRGAPFLWRRCYVA